MDTLGALLATGLKVTVFQIGGAADGDYLPDGHYWVCRQFKLCRGPYPTKKAALESVEQSCRGLIAEIVTGREQKAVSA